MKLNSRQDYLERFNEIVEKVKSDPTHLHINIFDEAHHSATRKDGKFLRNIERQQFVRISLFFRPITVMEI